MKSSSEEKTSKKEIKYGHFLPLVVVSNTFAGGVVILVLGGIFTSGNFPFKLFNSISFCDNATVGTLIFFGAIAKGWTFFSIEKIALV